MDQYDDKILWMFMGYIMGLIIRLIMNRIYQCNVIDNNNDDIGSVMLT
jgi:Na+/glutamate symporter